MRLEIEYDKLKKAVQRNPRVIAEKTNNFLVRTQAVIKQVLVQEPWKVGRLGGGIPIATGNLKKAHDFKIEPFKFSVVVNESKATYAKYVHGNKDTPTKVRGRNIETRPWLRYAEKRSEGKINQLAVNLLDEIVNDMGK